MIKVVIIDSHDVGQPEFANEIDERNPGQVGISAGLVIAVRAYVETQAGWADVPFEGCRGRSPSICAGAAGCLHPALWRALAAFGAIISLILVLVLPAIVLLSSHGTCERVFRLLRWITNRPEPPPPAY